MGWVAGGRGVAAAAQAACRESSAVEAASRARAERTLNMPCMVVTLEVSRLSGWLNADAPCRIERKAYGKGRRAGRETGGCGVAPLQATCREGLTVEAAGRARAERTLNMYCMAVTLEVSKLSGWLNADANCRVEGEA